MEEEYSVDPADLLIAASNFASHPGTLSDASAKDFLDRFPLPAVINVLQTQANVPGLENALVDCLERIFSTKYGASLIPHYMPFVVIGLGADSQKLKYLACKTVSYLLKNLDETTILAAQLILEHDVYPLLLNCLIDGDEQVASASMDAIKDLTAAPKGMDIVFPANTNEVTHLSNVAARCSSLGRVRVLALVVKLFSISSSVALVVYSSNLLNLLVAEVSNANDTLVTLSLLELLYELTEVRHSTEFLSETSLVQLLTSIINNPSADSILRSRAMMISGRLLSRADSFMFIDESSIKMVVCAIDQRFGLLQSQDTDELECALEALGQIGSSNQGATVLLGSSPPVARHIVDAAFDWQGRGKQLAALHALANISGDSRAEDEIILSGVAEESLRSLIYHMASKTPKLIPSGLFLSALQKDPEIRLAVYRLLKGLVARAWSLMEICSRQDIINIVTDPYTETTKLGMETRHKCCEAIYSALVSSNKLTSDPALSGIAAKLQEAIRRGPYLVKKHPESQPAVKTAERF